MTVTGAMEANSSSILAIGRQAIATEAEALWSLCDVDDAFVEAVKLIHDARGRLLVLGAGQSANIGPKLATTFSATGTPSCYLNALEALHGGIGVMVPGDVILMLSRTGEAQGCGAIVRWAQMLGVPIIAITANQDSLLARSADVHLLLPVQPEICPFGRTPTTSVTMMLVLGDAIAITLLRLKNITATDLHRRIPGASHGLDLLAVDEFMHRDDALPLARADASLEAVLDLMNEKGFGVVGLVNDTKRLLGVITDGDVRRNATKLASLRPEEIMTKRPRTLVSGALARDALGTMSQSRITSLFVLADMIGGQVIGLVHIHDVLRHGVA